MDAEILKSAGQIAGIGGLAMGVFMLLFREIIRKKLFPQLTKKGAERLLSLMAVLIFIIAAIGIGAWIWPADTPSAKVGGSGVANTGTMETGNIHVEGGTAKSDQPADSPSAEVEGSGVANTGTMKTGDIRINDGATNPEN